MRSAEFRDRDHLPEPATDIDADVRAHLRAEGEDPAGWRLTLVTNLRSLGYVFNPASFYLCRDGDGDLRLVIVEVHNTFGERHLYTLRRRPGDAAGAPFTAAMDKAFFVSPFIDVDGRYSVFVRDEPDGAGPVDRAAAGRVAAAEHEPGPPAHPAHRPLPAAGPRPIPADHPPDDRA